VAALVLWIASAVGGQVAAALARASRDPARELSLRRRLTPVVGLEHASFLVLLASGGLLMMHRGWRPDHARWLALKLGLVVFLVLPLEAMHAYVAHVWIARGLRQTPVPPFSKDLARGLGIEEMLCTLAVPLLGLGLPLLLWLSLAKPF